MPLTKKQPKKPNLRRPGSVPLSDPDAPKQINIRLLASEHARIQKLREKMPKLRGKQGPAVSLHDWIIDAVLMKLEMEEKKG